MFKIEKEAMTNKIFYKSFIIMTVTMAFQNVIVYGVNLADSIMMGAYSELALSGVGICNNIMFLLQMAVTGIANGMTVLASRYWGMKDNKSIYKVSSIGIYLSLFISIILTILCTAMPEQIINLFTDKQSVAMQAVSYLGIIKYTYIIFAITQILLAVLRSVETVRIGFYVSLSSFGLNVFLNYVLIYGKLGCPELGIKGAALATLISRIVELAVVFVYFNFIDKKLKSKIKYYLKSDREIIQAYLKKGSPLIFSSISWGLAMSVQGAIIGRLVEEAIAANSIATTIFQIASVIVYASATAACVLIGKTIGENADMETIKTRSKNLQLMFLCIGLLSSLLLLIFKNAIIGLYNASPTTIKFTTQFIYILSVTLLGTSYQCPTLTGIVSGGGETDFVFKNDLIWQWLIVIPCSALSAFIFKFPVAVTFACLKSDQVLKCIVAVIKVRKYNWIKKITK